jgi:WD40 repeat protein
VARPFSQLVILGVPAEKSSDARVLCIATHPSQSIIALGKNDHTVAFYNIETGE